MASANELLDKLAAACRSRNAAYQAVDNLHAQLETARKCAAQAEKDVRDSEKEILMAAMESCADHDDKKQDSPTPGLAIKVDIPRSDNAEVQALVGSIVSAVCEAIVGRLQTHVEGAHEQQIVT